MTPTILIATTSRWFTTARLAIAFAKLGCRVDAVCPVNNALRKTKAVRRAHTYQALSPIESFLYAMRASKPNLIVPGDDLASKHLHDLYFREKGTAQQVKKSVI